MPIDLEKLKDSPRILIEAALRPVAGTRIQPTGFPDLGAATYDAPDGRGGAIPTLLVESAQSMANRLEAVCWDEAADDLVPELKVEKDGNKVSLPYVSVKLAGLGEGSDTTSSLLEFHRLNSPYIMSGVTDKEAVIRSQKTGATEAREERIPAGILFADVLRRELRLTSTTPSGEGDERDTVAGVINLRRLAAVCFKYDPNSLVHGVFLEKIAGRLRHPRALSAFIEATVVDRADNGGTKLDRNIPDKKTAARVIGIAENEVAKQGYGNVPHHRTEFAVDPIVAYFSIDLAQLRGYGLPPEAYKLLVVLSLWKVRKFLDSNMRLRSACELQLTSDEVVFRYRNSERKEQTDTLDSAEGLGQQLRDLIAACQQHFANPAVTELTWNPRARTGGEVVIELPPDFPPPKPFKEPIKSLVEFKKKTRKALPKLVLKKGLTEDVVKQVEDALGKEDEVSKAIRAKLEENEPQAQDAKE